MTLINKEMETEKSNIRISRKDLYNLVWQKPITRLVKEFNVFRPAIRQACKEHNIPLPMQGHWMKLKHGKSSPKIPLPKGENEIIEIKKQYKARIEAKAEEAGLVYRVQNKLTNPNPLVIMAKELLNKQHSGVYGKGRDVVYSAGKCLATEVTRPNIPRALRLWDALLKLIIKRGHKISDPKESEFLILGEEFTIRIREILKRVKVEDATWERYEKIGSGILSIKVHQSYHKKEWRSLKSKPIEDQLLDILLQLEDLARKEKKERQEIKEWRKKFEKEQAKKKARQEKIDNELITFKQLFETASRWHKSQYLRNYIQEFENNAIQTNSLNEEKRKWINWAREKADWYDPLIEKEDEIFENVDRDTLEIKSKW